MLAYQNRLHTKDFPSAAKGRRLPFVGGTLVFIPGEGSFRAGVVVPKRVAKTAVVRNRIRRKIYRALETLLPVLPHGTCAVFPDANCQILPIQNISGSLRSVLVKPQV